MRLIKRMIIVVFIIISVLFIADYYRNLNHSNNTPPEIQMNTDILECSIHDSEDELLREITAGDKEDGDLTSGIIVESISNFVDQENHICNATYVVEDSDHHVTKATRKIKFTDYESPKFTLKQPLCFDLGSDVSVLDVLGATDERDGDISDKIKILSNTTSTSSAGQYTVTAQVTNSLGDTVKFKSNVVIKPENKLSSVIELKTNVAYVKKGENFQPLDYVKSVKDVDGHDINKSLVEVTNTNVDMKKKGSYSVEYTVNPEKTDEGITYLSVIVED